MSADLGPALKSARNSVGVKQIAVTSATGVSQARLSRIENGRSLPTEREVTDLARLYSIPTEEADRLVGLARTANAEVKDTRLVIQRGNTLAMQQRWRAMESGARVVRSFQPAVVLGGLQVPSYTAVLMGESIDSELVQDRVRRQDRLRLPGRRLVAIHTEGALRRTVGSAAVMAEQIDHLIDVSRNSNVELGVIPDRQPVDFAVASGFHIYDESAVVVGLVVAAATLSDDEDVIYFRDLFEQLGALAVFGEKARQELRRVGELHR